MDFALAPWQKYLLLLLSFCITAIGQPLWHPVFAILTACISLALFWRALLSIESPLERFFIGMGWYAGIQVFQLSWFLSHPYSYIYAVILFCGWLFGLQWGLLSIFIRPSLFSSWRKLFGFIGVWVLFEWSRLFIFSGFPFNPVGLSLSATVYSLQLATIGGIYGMSFWVLLTNLCAIRAWIFFPSFSKTSVFLSVLLFPYLFGWLHFHGQQATSKTTSSSIAVVVVQSALPIEESMSFQSAEEARNFVLEEWKQVLRTLTKQQLQAIDLIVFPEYVVPYGTYYAIFPLEEVQKIFVELFDKLPKNFPSLQSPYAEWVKTDKGWQWLVSNAYIAQTISNFFQADVVIGLEDNIVEKTTGKKKEIYNAALHFQPYCSFVSRYEKQILVPMGEYIPFQWCKELAARYGISGSFTGGRESKIFFSKIPFGSSICYEEIYGDLMRYNRIKGAELLVNLTNDGWYPNSSLPQQHFDHARLRTVENGIPLIRACNTGVTGAIDSVGQIIALVGDGSISAQNKADSLWIQVPTYHYQTLYTQYGDKPIIVFCLLAIFINLLYPIKYKYITKL